MRWTLSLQQEDGWFDRFSFPDGELNNLHGVSYTIRGVLDVGILFRIAEFVDKARAATDALLAQRFTGLPLEGTIPGHLSRGFKATSSELSPTELAQFSIICLKLAQVTGEESYRTFATRPVENLKCLHMQGFKDPCLNGLLPGSWPLNGRYQAYSLPNWPIKFFLDCLMVLEGADPLEVRG